MINEAQDNNANLNIKIINILRENLKNPKAAACFSALIGTITGAVLVSMNMDNHLQGACIGGFIGAITAGTAGACAAWVFKPASENQDAQTLNEQSRIVSPSWSRI